MAGRPPIPLAERFAEKVDRRGPDDCWLWTGSSHGVGYGGISVNGRAVAAHRVAYELEHGPVPSGQWVLHRCDTPRCVNPAHLFLGDHQANMDDMREKWRSANGHMRQDDRLLVQLLWRGRDAFT